MNKEEAVTLAESIGARFYHPAIDDLLLIGSEELLAFANACEKIGMEKTAKICRDASWIDGNAHLYADAILEATK